METCTPPLSWESLPADVSEIVFSKMDHHHLSPLRLVNSSWCGIINRSLKFLKMSETVPRSSVDSIKLSRKFMNVERLEMAFNAFCNIPSFKGLTELTLQGRWGPCRWTGESFDDVKHLTSLTALNTVVMGPENVEWLCTLTNLKSLSVLSTFPWRSRELSRLTNLTSLEFDRLTDLDLVSGLTNLKAFFLQNGPTDITPLSTLVKLTALQFARAAFLRSKLNVVAKLKNLAWLDITGNPLKDDVTVLTGLSKLTHLDLSSCSVTSEGVRSLTKLVSLKRLYLNRTCACDAIRLLVPLTGLEVLHLDYVEIKEDELKGLSNLVGLREASVRCVVPGSELRPCSRAALSHINVILETPMGSDVRLL